MNDVKAAVLAVAAMSAAAAIMFVPLRVRTINGEEVGSYGSPVSDRLLDAMAVVEGDDGRFGPSGESGPLRITTAYLKDVKRIAGQDSPLTLEEVKNPVIAKWAARKYLEHYGLAYERKTGRKPSVIVYARIHNGGPKGWSRRATLDYAARVANIYASTK